MYSFYVYFFFQAEDGIRYYKVTGVQTCALPILDAFQLFALLLLVRVFGLALFLRDGDGRRPDGDYEAQKYSNRSPEEADFTLHNCNSFRIYLEDHSLSER